MDYKEIILDYLRWEEGVVWVNDTILSDIIQLLEEGSVELVKGSARANEIGAFIATAYCTFVRFRDRETVKEVLREQMRAMIRGDFKNLQH